MTTDPPPTRWLQPQPVRLQDGRYCLPGNPLPLQSITEIVDQTHTPALLPKRTPEIRRALAWTLRFAFHPDYQGRGPWVPDHPRYRLFRSIIAPLLMHPLWQSVEVIAAPYVLHIPGRAVAGTADVIYRQQNGELAIAALHCARPDPTIEALVLAELGGLIAAACDLRLFVPSHAVAIYAAPGETLIQSHHPDTCLGLWVDAMDRLSFQRRVINPPADNTPTT